MACDQRTSQAPDLLVPAVQNLDSRLGTLEIQIGAVFQALLQNTDTALCGVEQRSLAQNQRLSGALQVIKDAIGRLQESQPQFTTAGSGVCVRSEVMKHSCL